MRMPMVVILGILYSLLCAPIAQSQDKGGFAGHWEGAVKVPAQDVQISVDLAKDEKGGWIGSLAMGASKGITLADIVIKGNSIHFRLPVAGGPVLDGKLSEDEESVTGISKQGDQEIPFELKRAGEAKVDKPPKSTPLSKEFEGTWEGVLDAMGTKLRLVLKLTKAQDGSGSGILDSLDQNASLPIDTVTQEGSNLNFEIRVVSGFYAGKMSAAKTEIVGDWTQGGNKLPLTFKRTQSSP